MSTTTIICQCPRFTHQPIFVVCIEEVIRTHEFGGRGPIERIFVESNNIERPFKQNSISAKISSSGCNRNLESSSHAVFFIRDSNIRRSIKIIQAKEQYDRWRSS